jgi:hypothetical protein
VKQISARRIALIRFLCTAGEMFSATDLYRNAVTAKGHRFLQTRFNVRYNEVSAPVHYCRCGQMAVRDESNGEFVALTSGPLSCELEPCHLAKN